MPRKKPKSKTPDLPAASSPPLATLTPARGKWRSAWLMLALTAILLTLLFPPFYCFFLAPVALVPFCVCIIRRPMRWRFIGAYYLCGVAFFLPNMYWIAQVDFLGFILLGVYLAIYFPLFAFGLHRLVNGLRLPAMIAVPLVWTAVEFVRSTCLEGGFPWFILGNCFARFPLLIQTADLFGVWGVTFFIAMLNGLVVDLLRLPFKKQGKINPLLGRLIAAAAIINFGVIAYGVFRLGQDTITDGPRVAVIQENIPQRVKDDPKHGDSAYQSYLRLAWIAGRAVPKPDLVAWPETMIGGPINPEILKIDETKLDDKTFVHRLKQYDADLKELANSTGAYQLVGAPGQTFDWLGRPTLRQNLTILYAPGTGQTSPVYAKRHLVPFGEYIPFRNFPYVGPYMVNISPYRDENNKPIDYSDAPGDQWTRFHLAVQAASEVAGSQPGHPELIITRTRIYTFATPICFEDTMPEPARMMTAPQFGDGRKTDFLINVSNDGWFLPAELDQRMQASQLRAVENRVPIARAVNTGNSGFVDSRGRIVKLVTGPNGESIGAVGTASLVMPLDSRITLFSQIGDLLPIISGIAAVLGIAWTFIRPRREGKTKPE